MQNLIDQYIYQVIRRVGSNKRNTVKTNLTSLIYHQLPESHTIGEVSSVLDQLGDPRILASNYDDSKCMKFYSRRIFVDLTNTLRSIFSLTIIIGIIATIFIMDYKNILINESSIFAMGFSYLWRLISVFCGMYAFAGGLTMIGFYLYDRKSLGRLTNKSWSAASLKNFPLTHPKRTHAPNILVLSVIINSLAIVLHFMVLFFLYLLKFNSNDVILPVFNISYVNYLLVPFILTILGLVIKQLIIFRYEKNTPLLLVSRFIILTFTSTFFILLLNVNVFNAEFLESFYFGACYVNTLNYVTNLFTILGITTTILWLYKIIRLIKSINRFNQ